MPAGAAPSAFLVSTGGDFASVPTCTRTGEAGCVVAFSTYAEDPPADTRFGKPTADPVFGTPGGPGFEVACTDPRQLSGLTGPAAITVPTEPLAPGPIAVGIVVTNGGPPPMAPTAQVWPADRFEGSCRTMNGANVLRYDPVGDSRRPHPFPDPIWSTHLIDVNYGLDRQVAIVAAQARTGWRSASAWCCVAALRPDRQDGRVDVQALPPDLRADAVALWHAAGLTRPWNDPVADLERALAGPASTVLAATDSGRLVGTVMLGHDGHRGWVYYLAVAGDVRRQGIGSALVRACEQWLVERGIPKLQLMVRSDNASAQAFYAPLGYDVVDVVVLGRRLDGVATWPSRA